MGGHGQERRHYCRLLTQSVLTAGQWIKQVNWKLLLSEDWVGQLYTVKVRRTGQLYTMYCHCQWIEKINCILPLWIKLVNCIGIYWPITGPTALMWGTTHVCLSFQGSITEWVRQGTTYSRHGKHNFSVKQAVPLLWYSLTTFTYLFCHHFLVSGCWGSDEGM